MDATDKKKIGKYEITGILGRGGMGVVYRAEDRRIGRQVAIKTLTEGYSGEEGALDRFYKEAQAGILEHPNIVTVYELGDEDGMPFIAMQFVAGDPLDKLVAAGKPNTLVEKLSIIEQVCAGLGYAHQQGVVHRDIKPANVIVQPDGRAKIVDFGIARVQKAGHEGGLTRTGNVIGTIHYIAPERLKGQPFDGRSDIFATGVMFYLMLTGQLPFTGEDMAVLHKLVNDPFPPLGTFLSNYPPALDGIMERALAKDPDHRYSTCEEFAADLHNLSEQLKKGQVAELFSDAERLTAEQQFGRAREVLLQLVRIDPGHTGARPLLSIVQQNLARLQRAEQIRQLVAEADEALASGRFTEALASLDQAIKSDPASEEIKAKLEEVREKKRRHDEIDAFMSQADALRNRGDITGALNAVEKAMRLDQENSGIRRMYVDLSRQAKLAAQQGQIREMIGKARQEINSRRFTAAIEILREVGTMDPSHAEMETLLQTAQNAQEQERRRKVLEQIQTEIENSLDSEDYDRATEQVERAVELLPNEPALLQLKTRITLQARKFRVRQLIDSTALKAQEALLQSPGEALLIVQKALQELPGEERLLALEDSIRQRLKSSEKEVVRARYLREAKDAIDRSQFEKAVEILESYQLEFADAAGVGELLEFAKSELAQQQRRARIASYASQAKALMDTEQFAQAIRLLEPACAETSDPALARLLTEARSQAEEAERKAGALLTRIARLRERGQLDEAIELLQGLPAAAQQGTPLNTMLTEIRSEKARKQALANAASVASKALEQNNFQAAIEALQSVQRAYGESAEITGAIGEIESRRAQFANESVARSVETARAALLANDVQAAVQALRGSAEMVEFAGAAQQADWRRLKAEAAKPQVRKTGQVPVVEAGETGEPRKKLPIPLLAGGALAVVAVAALLVLHPWTPKPPSEQQQQTTQGTGGTTTQQTGSTVIPAPPKPGPAVPTGTLIVQGSMDQVRVLVDGQIKGLTGKDGSKTLTLDQGSHTVQFKKPGFVDSQPSPVTIAAAGTQKLSYSLTAAAVPPPPEALLNIQSTPGAAVKIDGTQQATADGQGNAIVSVSPGQHSLAIDLAGYQSYTHGYTLKAGENVTVSANLTAIVKPVQIAFFAASASQIDQGQPTTLKWQTSNATEVSIDDGSGNVSKVQGSGEVTVNPSSDTYYMLTARGSDGSTQQKPLKVAVKAKAQPAQPTQLVQQPVNNQPAPPDDRSLLLRAIGNFKSAWNAHSTTLIQSAWTGMNSEQAKALQGFFKDNPKSVVSDDCSSSDPNISGDSATWTCVETTTLAPGGKPQARPIRFSFAKRGGAWTIVDRR